MRALWLVRHGQSAFEVRESPDPGAASGQVRIRVKAAGLNFSDVLASAGLYPDAPPLPAILGYEASGIIDAVGDGVDAALVGTRVMALAKFGAHTDTLCVAHNLTVPMPDSMTFEEAAAIPVVYGTAYHMLHRIACIRPGESILIHQAAGGVGIALLQLCAEVTNVTTFGTASSGKHEILRKLGCSHAIDYRTTDYARQIRQLGAGAGVDIVLDGLGGADWKKGYDLLNPCGRLICFGFANLAKGGSRLPHTLGQLLRMPKFKPLQLMSDNRAVAGVNLGHLDFAGRMDEYMRAIVALYDKGVVKPIIDAIVPFAEITTAVQRLREGKNTGKVVLIP